MPGSRSSPSLRSSFCFPAVDRAAGNPTLGTRGRGRAVRRERRHASAASQGVPDAASIIKFRKVRPPEEAGARAGGAWGGGGWGIRGAVGGGRPVWVSISTAIRQAQHLRAESNWQAQIPERERS
jgi:hypothetical protein